MTIPRQPQTCSHPIYARTLTGIHQAVRYFLLATIYVSISIGTLDNDSLSLSTPSRTKWTLIYLLLYSTILREGTNTGLEYWTGLLEWPAGLAYFNFMFFF